MLERRMLGLAIWIFILFFWTVSAFAQNPDSIPFAPAANYGAGNGPRSVFCADIDGDLDLDLVVANAGSDNVSILKNNGDGTFQPKVDYDAGTWPHSVFCADLDGDLDLDLAVANAGSDNVSILKNNGHGTFQTEVDYPAGDHPNSVFCADLDGDLDLDIVLANDGSDNVSILKNNGDGTFQTKVDYGTRHNPVSVFCADLDLDLDLDIAVGSMGDHYISILKNNGDGTFEANVGYFSNYWPMSLFCADLDGDLDLDLAVTKLIFYVSVFKNNGDGTFQPEVHYDAGFQPTSVFSSDLDGDSDLDLAVTNVDDNNVFVLRNNGDGTFQTKVAYSTGAGWPQSVFCADLDLDSDQDIAVANNTSGDVSILENLTVRRPVELWADIVGRGQIRFGQSQTYSVQCGNLGFSKADNLVVLIRIPTSVDIAINLAPPPPDPPVGIGWDQIPLGLVVTEDSSFILPIWVASLGPDSVIEFDFSLVAPLGQPDFSVEITFAQLMPDTAVVKETARKAHQALPTKDPWEDIANSRTTWEFYRKWQEWENDDPGWGQQAEDAYRQATRLTFWGLANTYGFGLMLRGLSLAGWSLYEQGIIQLSTALGMNGPELLNSLGSIWPSSECMSSSTSRTLPISPVGSWDPNDKVGPYGVDSISHYIPGRGLLKYVVYFENVDSATADAERVVVIDTLDSNLDWATLTIEEMSHPEACTATIDAFDGIVTWTCDSIMLPPDTLPPNGEGWVSFSIRAYDDLLSGTEIRNRASIKFDYNPWMYAPLDSSYIINTIDAERPSSSVDPLPDTTDIPGFVVTWSGMDDPGGSGIAAYTVYAKIDGGPYLPWLSDTTVTSAVFSGQYGHTYYFSCTSVDNVGNREERHLVYDTRTTVISYWRGDANGDGLVDVGDVVYLINYLYKSGTAPDPIAAGDANCDGIVDVGDVVYLINYLYKGGDPPCR